MTNEPSLEQQVDSDATQLFNLFEQHANKVDKESVRVSEPGLKEMSLFFAAVPRENRGYVFLNFLNKLYINNYSYDLLQFMDMEKVDEA